MNAKNTQKIQKTVKKSLDFETTLADIRRKNEKRAWMVAGIATFTSLCLMSGLFYVLPLKEKNSVFGDGGCVHRSNDGGKIIGKLE